MFSRIKKGEIQGKKMSRTLLSRQSAEKLVYKEAIK
jgi:hypothetical protein